MNRDLRHERLHAFVDGQLNAADRARLLDEMDRNPALREQVWELQRVKEHVSCAFPLPVVAADAAAPRARHWPFLTRGMAALLLLVVGFSAGRWSGSAPPLAAADGQRHVILHVSSAEEGKFVAALADAEALAAREGDDMQVEIVTNGAGLDLVRSDRSPVAAQVRRMLVHYRNIQFVACNVTINKQHALGDHPHLIEGIQVTPSAGDYILRRMEQGWSYLRV